MTKLHHLFFQNTCQASNLRDFRTSSLKNYACNIYIVKTSASDFKHEAINTKLHVLKVACVVDEKLFFMD